MSKSSDKKKFINKPYYEGGNKALGKFIEENLNYPKQAIEHKIEGQVQLIADIDYKGSVVKAKVKKSLGYGCDEEAVRVAHLIKFHVEVNKGLRVTFHKTLNIQFRLPKKPAVKINYSITNSEGNQQSPPNKSVTYSYTIKKKS